MKIRIYFPFFPFPVTEGAYLVVTDQIRYFSSKGYDVELVCWRESAASVAKKIATGGWPAGAKYTLLGEGRESRLGRFRRVALSLFGNLASPELFLYPPQLLGEVGRLGDADLAIYHYSYAYTWLVESSRLPLESKRVVHFHNVESDLHPMRPGMFGWIHRRNARILRSHEEALMRAVDELWFLSPLDAKRLGVPSARIIPPTFDPALRERRRICGSSDVVAGFIGGLNFEPNCASVRWILDEVAPLLAKSGFGGRLLIAGKALPESLRQRGSRFPFVEFLGFVEDLDMFWASLSFLVAPHIIGSGVRTKILEGIASGVPVLTNSGGAEPLPRDVQEDPLLICRDDPADWARILLLESRPRATRDRFAGGAVCAALTAEHVYAQVA